MRLRDNNNGGLLGDRVHSNGNNRPHSSGPVPLFRNLGQPRGGRLLHERHDNGFHWRTDTRHCHRAQQSPYETGPRGNENRRMQSRPSPRWSLHCHHFYLDVDIQHRGYSYDDTHYIRRTERTRKG